VVPGITAGVEAWVNHGCEVLPRGGDWAYTVASALASQKHNPAGSIWFSSALVIAMALLWRYVSALKKGLDPAVVQQHLLSLPCAQV